MGRRKSGRTRLRTFAAFLTVVVMVIALHDFFAPHGRGYAARAAIFLIDEYRAHLSPRLSGVVTCRFTPSCSAYGRAAIAKYGFAKGSAKAAWRIARCGSWTERGTVDRP